MPNTVEELLSNHSPDVRALAQALRDTIREAVPETQERVYGGWKLISYGFDASMKGQFCGIIPHTDHVNVQFPQGVHLDDPNHLLQGSGKRSRHVKVKTMEEARADGLKVLVREAAALIRPDQSD